MRPEPGDEEQNQLVFLILLVFVVVGTLAYFLRTEPEPLPPCRPILPNPDCPPTHVLRETADRPMCMCRETSR